MLTQAVDFYKTLAPTGADWLAIAPEIMMGLLALVLLGLDLVVPKKRACWLSYVAVIPQILLLLFCLRSLANASYGASREFFDGMLLQSATTELLRVFFLVCSILVCQLGGVVLKKQGLPRTEFNILVLIATAALMFLGQCRHFLVLFVALETFSICMYVLVAYIRHSTLSLEAALKYIVQSSLSSALLLMGIVFLYGVAGNPALPGACDDPLSFRQLGEFITLNPGNIYVLGGAVLVIAGFLFKIAAVPFQIWVSDVYQGAPTPVTAFLGVASKAAGFVLLMNVLFGPFAALGYFMLRLLSVVAVLTILFGNLAALGQQNVKRLMGLSGIAHAGYMLMGVCAAYTLDWAVGAVYLYLFVYLLASFTLFGVMSLMSGDDDAIQTLDDYAGLMRRDSLLGGVMIVALGSLAGIPPMAGFVAKLLLFVAAFKAGLYGILGVALLGVVLSIYYYFTWMRQAVFVPYRAMDERESSGAERSGPVSAGFWMRTMLTSLAILTVVLGFWQGFLSVHL